MNQQACDRVRLRLLFIDQRNRNFQRCVLFMTVFFNFFIISVGDCYVMLFKGYRETKSVSPSIIGKKQKALGS